ncbi:S4 domain-containing protein [uncultured Limnohabitans sp.]|jgi:23S rRNA pseudouridine2604 synthase|uniref:S4 domain-containing protein n=1 Tax=uncultured Limnohabitans sp. TaxID=768543 RepID=UPI002627AC61|nr:S4 domain-containing protein [uncultured Limnohabitans sp.]
MISSEEGIRLAKRVAAEQTCSRREAEALIVAGGVQVAGKVVTDPARRVRPEQTVQVNRLVSMAALAPMTLVLFKPAHRVANLAWLQDTVGLKAAQPGLWGPERLAKMLMPLPLAKPTSGLCIFSDDVGVLRHLEDRRSPMEQEWMATIGGEVPESLVKALNGPGIRASINRQTDSMTVLRIAGKDIDGLELGRWLDEQCPLQDLRRQRVGRLSLAPLEAGQWRSLEGYERF